MHIRSADGCLVQLGPFHHPYSTTTFPLDGTRQDLGGLVFEGCIFRQYLNQGTSETDLDAARGQDPGPPYYYRDTICFCAMETRELRIDDSFFYGRVRANIRAWGGRMTLTNVNFVSVRVRMPKDAQDLALNRYGSVQPSASAASDQFGAEDAHDNGCDIFLEFPGPGVRSTAVHVRSAECQTWRHFASWPTSRYPKAEHAPGDIIEEDVRTIIIQTDDDHNAPLYEDEPPVLQRPPSIVWDGPSRRGSAYVSSGVHVGGFYPRDSRRTIERRELSELFVIVGEPRGEVVDLGSREGLGGPGILLIRPEVPGALLLNSLVAPRYGFGWYRYLLPFSAER
ncbi:MAG: hypothetical protein R3A52_23965 [Polyangiales bacterium]